jgi:purine-binding chemotaxis protein CheW
MKNNNDEAMKNYFDSMLCGDQNAISDEDNKKQDEAEFSEKESIVNSITNELPQSKLSVSESSETTYFEPESLAGTTLPKHLVFASTEIETLSESEAMNDEVEIPSGEWQNINVEDEFQVLFFELNQVTFAIPLTDLGGIYPLDKTLNALPGKPSWLAGVINHSDRLYNIVDSASWLKFTHDTHELNYTHFIVLGDSSWGLSCEKLCGASLLQKEQVRWRENEGSRPWLAGMVKDKMCVLIHAQELAKLLDKGMDIKG